MLSYAEIGSAAILSRAVGGLMGRLVVLVMPGSRAAVELAMSQDHPARAAAPRRRGPKMTPPASGPPRRVSIFGCFTLIPLLAGGLILFLLVRDGARSGHWLAGLVGGLVLVPIAILLVFAILVGGALFVLFLFSEDEATDPRWARPLRLTIKGATIAIAIVWIAMASPTLLRAQGIREAWESAATGILTPLGLIIFMVLAPAMSRGSRSSASKGKEDFTAKSAEKPRNSSER